MTIESTVPWGETTVQRTDRRRGRRRRPVVALALLAALLLLVVTVRASDSDPAADPPAADCHAAACTGEPGVSGGGISRTEIAARADQWLADADIPYSMTEGHAGPGGWGWYRRDCSGFVSMALRLPDDNGGASTIELADVVSEVPAAELRPFDLIGRLGPGSGGERGHVQLFLGWADAAHTRVRVAEQGSLGGGVAWPHVTTYDWPERMADGTALRAYRYAEVTG